MDYLTHPVYYLEDNDIDDNGLIKKEYNPKNLPIFILIQSTWCGHCKYAKPEFQKFAEKNKGKVLCFSIQADANNENVKKLMSSQKMKKMCPDLMGFPTYVFQRNGKSFEYNSGRKEENLQQFLNQNS